MKGNKTISAIVISATLSVSLAALLGYRLVNWWRQRKRRGVVDPRSSHDRIAHPR